MQSASLCLTCTPAEELAVGVRTLMRPLGVFKAPVNEIGETADTTKKCMLSDSDVQACHAVSC